MGRLTKETTELGKDKFCVPYSEENEICLTRRKYGIKTCSWYYGKAINKLGELEDVMERLKINSIADLEDEIKSLRIDKEVYRKQCNTWKKACELACETFCTGSHNEMREEIKELHLTKEVSNYFYQKIKEIEKESEENGV